MADEEAPLIYGLEFQARALVAEKAPAEVTRFMVGSQTLKFASNQIHIIELNDETGALFSQVYSHPIGEVWHLDWSPFDSSMFLSTYQCLTEEENLEMSATLWKMVEDRIENLGTVGANQDRGNVKMSSFHPTDKTKMLCASENTIEVFDIGDGGVQNISSLSASAKDARFSLSKWSPEERVDELLAIQGTSVIVWDTRQPVGAAPSWKAENCHQHLVRDLDVNRNRCNVFATGGDDGKLKFWDRRGNSTQALAEFTPHHHWVTAVRINNTHDQLILTSATDCQVVLSCCSSCASEPVLSESVDLGDSAIKSYRHHEDSVCCVEWSPLDPWTFASLSYDGRLLASIVPNRHKYAILGI